MSYIGDLRWGVESPTLLDCLVRVSDISYIFKLEAAPLVQT